jgi:CHASE2 domain-containing sensor protein
MIQLILTVIAGLTGYLIARNFVRNRLRYVDAIHARWAPLLAGTLAFLLAWPVALLPLLSAAPAVVFGIGIGLGTASGARTVRRSDATRRRITP